jgi:tetratricopeptide (TPR) repeat protein
VALVAAALLLLVLAVYGQTVGFPFAPLDDDIYVYANPTVAPGLATGFLARAFSLDVPTYWHPLTWLSLQLDATLFGLDPAGFHLVNVCWHAANVLLFLALGLALGLGLWPSALAAALFAVHPMHVESVAWITARKDVLSGFFWLSGLLAYVRYARRPSPARYGLVALLLALGLMAKAALIVLPCALLLLDFWPLGRAPWSRAWTGTVAGAEPGAPSGLAPLARPASWSRLILEKLPLLALGMLVAAVAALSHPPVTAGPDYPLAARLANALVSYPGYLRRLFWPEGLALHVPFRPDLPGWQVLGAALLLAGITAAALALARRRPWLAVGWLWFLGVMVPMLKLYSLGQWYHLADRFAYLPYQGLYLALALAWREATAGLERRLAPGAGQGAGNGAPAKPALGQEPEKGPGQTKRTPGLALAGIAALGAVLALALAGHREAGRWRDPVTLLERTVEVEPTSALARENLAVLLLRAGGPQALPRVLALARSALELDPASAGAAATAGAALNQMDRPAEALSLMRAALDRGLDSPALRTNLGLSFSALGRPAEALEQHRLALGLDPLNVEAMVNLGLTLTDLGRPAEAAAVLEKAVALAPGLAAAWNNLGMAHLAEGQPVPAVRCLERALSLSPGHPRMAANLAAARRAMAQDAAQAAPFPASQAPPALQARP